MTLATFAGSEGSLFLAILVAAIVQIVKWNRPSLTKGQKGLLSIGVGILFGVYLTVALSLSWWEQPFWGFVAGLEATGAYKLGKQAFKWQAQART